jgi:hypothetical protein
MRPFTNGEEQRGKSTAWNGLECLAAFDEKTDDVRALPSELPSLKVTARNKNRFFAVALGREPGGISPHRRTRARGGHQSSLSLASAALGRRRL